MKGLIRTENLSTLFGDDYEFNKEERLIVIHSEKTGRTITLGSIFPTNEIADEVFRYISEKRTCK